MRVAILTPDPRDEGYRTRWRDVAAVHEHALRADRIEVERRPWTDTGDLRPFDLVMPLLAWGYHRALDEWRRAVDRWQAQGARLANPPDVLRWNADKSYLARLAAAGAPTVPTLYFERLDLAALRAASERFGTDRLIAKPRISASAWRTIRWSPGMAIDAGPDGPALVQPYLPAIESEGELSLLYFGGAYSHAIRKRPQPGDFRVQPEYDGIIAACAPAPDEKAAAERILGAAGPRLAYARIDLVRGLTGAPELMELELVEPDLYLQYDPKAGARFAAAVRSAAAADPAQMVGGEV